MNFTPLDQAYQVHHGNPSMYTTNKIQTINPKCIFCGNTNTIPLMEKQDGGIFRQCSNQLCRKQFTSTKNDIRFDNASLNQIQSNQIQQMPLIQQTQNPYLPQEPNFITRFSTNSNTNQKY